MERDHDNGDEALKELTTTLLFLFSHGNIIPKPLLERLQWSVNTTFYPNSPSASHFADHVGAVYEVVREILEDDAFTNAIEALGSQEADTTS